MPHSPAGFKREMRFWNCTPALASSVAGAGERLDLAADADWGVARVFSVARVDGNEVGPLGDWIVKHELQMI